MLFFLQRFARRVLERMRAIVNAEKAIKRSVMFYKHRMRARFNRQVEWLRERIAVRRIERKWFVAQAFRARVMVSVVIVMASFPCTLLVTMMTIVAPPRSPAETEQQGARIDARACSATVEGAHGTHRPGALGHQEH